MVEAELGGQKALLLSPTTFMNLSGTSVQEAKSFYKLADEELLVICDDLNLPVGKLRFRARGSSGGQKGLEDIIRRLGTEEFSRLRIGVGTAPDGWDWADYVLSKFTPEELPVIEQAVGLAAEAVAVWAREGMETCMNRYNSTADSEKTAARQAAAVKLADQASKHFRGVVLWPRTFTKACSFWTRIVSGGTPTPFPTRFRAMIEKVGGEMLVSRLWEERRLAYPIKGQRKGTYWLTYFRLDSVRLGELRRQCQITDDILRVLFLKVDPRIVDALVAHAKSAPVPAVATAEEAKPPDGRDGRGRTRGRCRGRRGGNRGRRSKGAPAMASYNRVILVGNLTRDPELRYLASGTAVTDIGLAVNDRRKNANGEWIEETTFVDVTVWGRTAEVSSEYLSKGSPVLIEGRLKLDTWETKTAKSDRS